MRDWDEDQDEEGGKRIRSKEDLQGTKRKAGEDEDEEQDIGRLIEEEVDRVNPGWVRGQPSKSRHIGEVEIA